MQAPLLLVRAGSLRAVCARSVILTAVSLHAIYAATLFAEEPNDTFVQSTILEPGTLSISDDLSPGTGTAPDTFLGAFDEGGFDPFFNFIADDDDSSTFGNGEASGLTGIDINADSSIRLIVTGSGDLFFEGDHSQSGGYKGFVEVFDAGEALIDEFSFNGALQPDIMDMYTFADSNWLGGSYTVNLDNTVDGFTGGDVDFFTFTGLTPGAMFSAETSSVGTIDTVLGWYDDAGSLVALDDDSGLGVWSQLDGVVPTSGQLTFAITGSGDDAFVGEHAQQEVYSLQLTLDGAVLPGDFEGDGDVDIFDLTNPVLGWEARYGIDLDGEDYLVWQQEFGNGTLAASVAAPEPCTALLLLAGMAVACLPRQSPSCSAP